MICAETFFRQFVNRNFFHAAALFALIGVLAFSSVHAANAVVATTADTTNGGSVSLRDAINTANAGGGGTITFSGTVFAPAGGPYIIQLGGVLPDLNSNITITGPGANVLTVSGQGSGYRIFRVTSGKTVGISGLTINNGSTQGTAGSGSPPTAGQPGVGGGIYNSGNLTLTLCVLTNNSVSGGSGGSGAGDTTQAGAIGADGLGGGVYSDGTALSVVRCTFSGNHAQGGGGGGGGQVVNTNTGGGVGGTAGNGKGGAVYVFAGTLSVTTSTFAMNTASGGSGGGGGATNFAGGEAAGGVGGNGEGGGIYTISAATVTSCTFGLNSASPGNGGSQNNFTGNANEGTSHGGGIRSTGSVTVGNSIVAQNNSTDAKTSAVTESDVFGTFVSANFNLIGFPDPTVTTFTGSADQKGTVLASPLDAKLDPLGAQNNGGAVTTIRLRKNSPAVDKGKDLVGQGIDEIGNTRPIDLPTYTNAAGGDASDIGAFEAQTPPNDVPTTTDQQFSGSVGTAFSNVQVTAADGDNDPLTYIKVSGTMPAGLTLNANGTITGTPTAPANGTVVNFKVNDGQADSATHTLTFNITEAQSLVVTTNVDNSTQYDGLTSLREAIQYAAGGNAGANPVITFDPTFFATARTITLSSSQITITTSVEIDGSAAGVTLSGGDAVSLFQLYGFGGTVNIKFKNLTLAHGHINAFNNGNAVNIQNAGSAPTVTFQNCTFSANGGDDTQGGAIYNTGGTVTLLNCTLAGNHADFGAGANTNSGGGAICNASGTMTIQNCTIALNHSNGTSGHGGGIQVTGGTLNLGNSIVAANTATNGTGPDAAGTITSQGYNLVGNTSGNTITGTTTGNQTGVSAGLAAGGLANNGGPTQTIALAAGSLAIDQGKTLGGVSTDQRGVTRPYDNPSIPNAAGGDGCDIGAFEAPPSGPIISVQQPAGVNLTSGVSTVSFGTVDTNASPNLVFTILSAGSQDLTLTGSPAVSVSGTNAAAFTVTVQPTSPVTAGNSTTFTVKFAPGTIGAKSAALSIASNDANSPFTVALSGTGADLVTQTPTLTTPATNSATGNPVNVAFTLPEAAKAGTVKLSFGAHVLTLTSAEETAGTHTFSFNPANPAATAAAIASGAAIPDGTYTVVLSYQDVPGNPAATATSTNVRIDTIVPTITGTVANQAVNDNAFILPFINTTINDADAPPPSLNVTITLSDTAKGTLTTLNGFTDAGGGLFTFSGTATAATSAIRGVVFTPAGNRLPAGQTETETFTITAGISSPTATDNTTSVVITSVNHAPAISSGPTATPNPATVGQSVSFSVVATDLDNDTLTFTWDFKDGTNGSGANPTHTFTAPGTFAVSVSVSDGTAAPVTGTINVVVNPGPALVGSGVDSDGDGFSDSFEIAAGSNPNDPTSTPTGGAHATLATITPLTITKATIKLNFTKQGPTDKHADSIAFSGTVAIPAGFAVTGQKVALDVGGVSKAFTLDKNGNAKSADGSVKLGVKAKKGVVAAQTSKFSVSLTKGAFAASLADEGLTGDVDIKKPPKAVTVVYTLVLNNTILQKSATLNYTAVKGKSGTATLPKIK